MPIWDDYIKPGLVVVGTAGTLAGSAWLGANYQVTNRNAMPYASAAPAPSPSASVAQIRITSGTPDMHGSYIVQINHSPNGRLAYSSGPGNASIIDGARTTGTARLDLEGKLSLGDTKNSTVSARSAGVTTSTSGSLGSTASTSPTASTTP